MNVYHDKAHKVALVHAETGGELRLQSYGKKYT